MPTREEILLSIKAEDKASGPLSKIQGGLDGLGKSARGALGGGGSTRVGAGVGGFSITGSLAGIAGGATGAGLAIAALGKGLWSASGPAREFEKTMSSVQAIMQPTKDEFVSLGDEAKRLGATTSFTATQSAEAYVKLGQAGLTASESLGALEPTLNAAAAGGLSLASAADIGTNIMSGMGLEVTDLDHVMDALAKTSTSTNTDITGLGNAFKYGGAVAKSSGLTFDETTAILGALADAGLKGSSAGTALSNALIKMQKPGEKAKRIMDAANLTFVDTDGKLRPLPDIIDDVAVAGLTTAEKIELFGQRGLRAMSALDEKGSAELRSLTGAITNSDGAAKAMADTMLNNVGGSVTKFQSAIEGLQIALAEGLLPHLKTFIDWITSGVSSVTNFIEEMKKAHAAGGPMPKWANQLVALKDLGVLLFELLVSGVQTFLGAINTLVAPLDALVSWAVTGEGSLKAVWNSATTAANELKDTVVANNASIHEDVKTLSGSVTKIYTDEKDMKIKASNDAIDASIAANERFLEKFKENKDTEEKKVLDVAQAVTKTVQDESKAQGDAIKSEVHNVIIPAWDDVFGSIDDHYKELTAKSPLTGGDAANALTAQFGTNLDSWLTDSSAGFKSKWTGGGESAEKIAKDASALIGKSSQKVMQSKFNEDLRADFKAGVKAGLGRLMSGDLGGFFRGIGSSMLGSITGKMSDKIAGAFTNTVFGGESGAGLMTLFKGKGSMFGGGMLKSLGGVFGGTGGAAGGLVGVLGTAVPMAGLALVGLKYGKQIWAGMKKAFGAIGGFFKNIFGNVGGAIGGLFGAGKKATIESAWDPRILKELFDQGFKVGDKVEKEHAQNIGARVGAGQGLKDGFSFRDLKGNEERADRQRTNEEALRWSLAEAERQGVILTQAEKDRILGVRAVEVEAVGEVKDAELEALEELGEARIEEVKINSQSMNDFFDSQAERADEFFALQKDNEKKMFELRGINETMISGPIDSLRVTNEKGIYDLQMQNINSVHTQTMENVNIIKSVVDEIKRIAADVKQNAEIAQRRPPVTIQALDAQSFAGYLRDTGGDAMVEEIQRRSSQGEQVVYDTGVVDTGTG